MRIAITHTMGSEHKWQKYIGWLSQSGIPAEHIVLSYNEDNLQLLDGCDGLILTGGNDVDPSLYGGPVHHPAINDVDTKRDTFERKALDKALQSELPVLGICRGLQLVNVHLGGTLIPDLEEAGLKSHRGDKEYTAVHGIQIEKESNLYTIAGCANGQVNTSHHQAVDHPGKGLKVVARSDDGVIEAMESTEHAFLQLVQWHPERMKDARSPLSYNILKFFLTACSFHSLIIKENEGSTHGN